MTTLNLPPLKKCRSGRPPVAPPHYYATEYLNFYRATHMHSAVYAVSLRLSVYLSLYFLKISRRIIQDFKMIKGALPSF